MQETHVVIADTLQLGCTCTLVKMKNLFFIVIWGSIHFHVLCFLVPFPDNRISKLKSQVFCQEDVSLPSILTCSYNYTPSAVYVTYKQVICAEGVYPMLEQQGGGHFRHIYYPEVAESHQQECIFKGPTPVVINGQPKKRYFVHLSLLWSDGYPGWNNITCDRPAGESTDSDGGSPEDDGVGSPENGGVGSPEDNGTGSPEDDGGGSPEDDGGGSPEDDGGGSPGKIYDQGGISSHVTVTPSCNNQLMKDSGEKVAYALLHLLTDIHMSAVAHCYNNSMVDFVTQDNVNFYLKVFYYQAQVITETGDVCIFVPRSKNTYWVKVEVSWGERHSHVHTYQKSFSVTCTYPQLDSETLASTKASGGSTVKSGFMNFQSASGNGGRFDALSTITLRPVNVLGQPILSATIPLGRTIRLRADSDGGSGELGLTPVTCHVIGANSNKRYAILRAGCGDGVIIPKHKGFITEGCTCMSPYFTTFSLATDSHLQFECSFTLCEHNCDGTSCHGTDVNMT